LILMCPRCYFGAIIHLYVMGQGPDNFGEAMCSGRLTVNNFLDGLLVGLYAYIFIIVLLLLGYYLVGLGLVSWTLSSFMY
jgi:hypothetical protein